MNKFSGLDVHKDSVFTCIIDEKREKNFEKRFGTLTLDLMELRTTLSEYGVTEVALESTCMVYFSFLLFRTSVYGRNYSLRKVLQC
jgi:hypothetical protein